MPSAEFKKKGTFADVVLPALLVHAVNARFTGMFRAERDSIIKVIYFKEGEIAFASSNQPSDRLGEVLIKRGQLTREQLDMAMSKLEANVSLGRMLVELGYLSPKELLSGAKTQVEEILYSLNTWKDGAYEFTEGPLPPRIVDLKLNTRQVIFQCILQVEDRRWALEQLGSMESVFAPQPELAEALQQMRLDPEVQQVVANIDGTNTVRNLASRSRLDEFTVTKIVSALYLLNLTRMTAHEAAEHGGEYLARFGEESETAASDSTVIGRPPGSETMPGFAPGFSSGSSFGGSPFGGFDEPVGDPTLRPSQTFTMPPTPSPLEDDEETGARPGFAEEPLVSPSDDEEPAEEMAYEEEGLDEDVAPERPRWLIPAVAAAVLLALGGAGYWFLYGRAGAGGGQPTPIARLSPAASATRPVAATSGTPLPVAGGTVSPHASLSPATATLTPAGSRPLATATLVAGQTPLTTPTPIAINHGPSPRPTATGAIAHMSPALTPVPAITAKPTPTSIVMVSPPPSGTPTGVVKTTPPLPTTTRPAVTPAPTMVARGPGLTPPPIGRTTPPLPVGRSTPPVPPPTPRATPPRATAAAGSGSLSGPAATAAHDKLAAGQIRDAAQGYRQAAAAATGYTIQLEIVCQDGSVREGAAQSPGGSDYFILPFSYRGRACYRAFWGVYPSRAAAEQAARTVPAFFRNQARGRALPVVPLASVR